MTSKKNNAKKIICVDFDGVLHAYRKGWYDGSIYDRPVPGAKEAVKKLTAAGFAVTILTTRKEKNKIKSWLKKWRFPALKISRTKMQALAYIDDRGIRFQGNWEDIVRLFI